MGLAGQLGAHAVVGRGERALHLVRARVGRMAQQCYEAAAVRRRRTYGTIERVEVDGQRAHVGRAQAAAQSVLGNEDAARRHIHAVNRRGGHRVALQVGQRERLLGVLGIIGARRGGAARGVRIDIVHRNALDVGVVQQVLREHDVLRLVAAQHVAVVLRILLLVHIGNDRGGEHARLYP